MGDFEWPSSPRKAKLNRKTLIQYVIYVQLSFTVSHQQCSSHVSKNSQLMTVYFWSYAEDNILVNSLPVSVCAGAARRRKESLHQWHWSGVCWGAVQPEVCFILSTFTLVSVSAHRVLINSRVFFVCAAPAGSWWTRGTRPACIIFTPSDQCSMDAPHLQASQCMLGHCWPVDSTEETASWYSVWKQLYWFYHCVSFSHDDDKCVNLKGSFRS